MDAREIIARRVAKEFKDGMVINLGFGIPTLSSNFIPEGINVILQTENGGLLFGPKPERGHSDPDVANAGGEPITMLPGSSTFDLAVSFGIIRGGHVDATVLGALEVDENGNIANWKIPGKFVPGMGGGMDLLVGAKRVIVAMTHTDKKGNPKILKNCTLPLSASGVVNLIITEKAVIEVTPEGLLLKEISPNVTLEEVIKSTEAELIIPQKLQTTLV
ncbi:butyrate--acetoacetate CoA-transferase subunit B [Clostridium pasteurianum DSM 525 = ATCC 6013]|jgi:3-oxoacid CoA-transferase subunit B/acetate CoA/acetoacetate CoA-transferase beta subunit|uniref:3-oxoacid CoA-transferase, B subunit n=1 Tax=Clostridium pasteurianum DSM 525 = ATCC 6013 TaxID=1262449 RepID=A0A0H3J0W0_CLOPA|nr:3-oxoacid CoA-transferase subunit B [Clostridium pasteurianum]AJA46984.1 butyrate--acetoacetate CoA-transferase subunit B [Clostridium pasteurianum DSM 525 = ATCC 6013]AJA50972.1 butyrate--acetoacetate CoA-transferase subunit B [Clostridium pasteurianum DSM 525 = ATCC 6013]AOZ74362.1 acetate CoA-transferase [Clostridium pasteurianum DSM 525 = ATCC 6013]AOZ78160.1 acetate CoA-transferase [Clostridium pasteurianum]ELP58235.1 butyrate-acetoacetate CoA-transferase subunit B [Clostridium pasteur